MDLSLGRYRGYDMRLFCMADTPIPDEDSAIKYRNISLRCIAIFAI
jgi:hypothetical protein